MNTIEIVVTENDRERVLYAGSYRLATDEEQKGRMERVKVVVDSADINPVSLVCSEEPKTTRELTLGELQQLQSESHVVFVHCAHPSAAKYNSPLASTWYNEFKFALVSDLGFTPCCHTTVIFEDTSDDSPEVYTLTCAVTPELLQKLMNMSTEPQTL